MNRLIISSKTSSIIIQSITHSKVVPFHSIFPLSIFPYPFPSFFPLPLHLIPPPPSPPLVIIMALTTHPPSLYRSQESTYKHTYIHAILNYLLILLFSVPVSLVPSVPVPDPSLPIPVPSVPVISLPPIYPVTN